MENWVIVTNLGLILVNLLLAVVLWLGHRTQVYRDYAVYWFLGVLNFFGQGVAGDNPNLAIMLFGIGGLQIFVVTLLASSLFAVEAHMMAYASLFLGGFILSAVGILLDWPVWMKALPLCVSLGWMLFKKVWQVVRTVKRPNVEEGFFLVALTLLGIHILDFPWLRFAPSGGAIGFTIAILIGSMFSVITSAMMAARAQRKYLDNKSTAEVRESFLRIITHDISNPLSAARSFAELSLAQRRFDHVEKVVWALDQMINIIKYSSLAQLLSTGKPFETRPVNVAEMFAQLELLFSGKSREKDIKLSFVIEGAPFYVLGDKTSLTHQVFANLISNSIKFSPVGSSVEVTATVGERLATFKICDRGIGMHQKIVRCLFDPALNFSRRGTNGEWGSGYGMPLVATHVKAFNGTIEVVSVPQEESPELAGTTVTLSFPVHRE